MEFPAGVILALLISWSTEGENGGGDSTIYGEEVNKCGYASSEALLTVFLQRGQTFAQGIEGRLNAIREVKLCQQMTDMSADRYL